MNTDILLCSVKGFLTQSRNTKVGIDLKMLVILQKTLHGERLFTDVRLCLFYKFRNIGIRGTLQSLTKVTLE